MIQSLGRHILAEFHGCDPDILDDVDRVEQEMTEAARRASATIVSTTFHRFNPYGISGVVVIAESHLAIHTWPEYGYASVDLYTCGEECDPWAAMDYLSGALSADRVEPTELRRGKLDTNGRPLLHKPVEVISHSATPAAPT